ncbi:unnamed protein product [Amoebophrya sp. A25]|nr:unnamed protein product [Amoebophrya sp. A25]|eukprot:GSA25T00016738001.1
MPETAALWAEVHQFVKHHQLHAHSGATVLAFLHFLYRNHLAIPQPRVRCLAPLYPPNPEQNEPRSKDDHGNSWPTSQASTSYTDNTSSPEDRADNSISGTEWSTSWSNPRIFAYAQPPIVRALFNEKIKRIARTKTTAGLCPWFTFMQPFCVPLPPATPKAPATAATAVQRSQAQRIALAGTTTSGQTRASTSAKAPNVGSCALRNDLIERRLMQNGTPNFFVFAIMIGPVSGAESRNGLDAASDGDKEPVLPTSPHTHEFVLFPSMDNRPEGRKSFRILQTFDNEFTVADSMVRTADRRIAGRGLISITEMDLISLLAGLVVERLAQKLGWLWSDKDGNLWRASQIQVLEVEEH